MERINTIGRRKNSIARVYMTPGEGKITINGREFEDYFPTEILRLIVEQPFEVSDKLGQFDIRAICNGGGVKGQAEAVRLGIARALVEFDAELKSDLRANGLVTRDPRMVERKKYGRRKARRRFQFSKR